MNLDESRWFLLEKVEEHELLLYSSFPDSQLFGTAVDSPGCSSWLVMTGLQWGAAVKLSRLRIVKHHRLHPWAAMRK